MANMRGMTKGSQLCLNMIVRNEMANFERCLGAVADHGACWVIGDSFVAEHDRGLVRHPDPQVRPPWQLCSVKSLVRHIGQYIEHWNEHPTPFVWTKTPAQIIRKAVRRGR